MRATSNASTTPIPCPKLLPTLHPPSSSSESFPVHCPQKSCGKPGFSRACRATRSEAGSAGSDEPDPQEACYRLTVGAVIDVIDRAYSCASALYSRFCSRTLRERLFRRVRAAFGVLFSRLMHQQQPLQTPVWSQKGFQK